MTTSIATIAINSDERSIDPTRSVLRHHRRLPHPLTKRSRKSGLSCRRLVSMVTASINPQIVIGYSCLEVSLAG
ncbi:hypothetical protein OUZ56_020029 [Daphnia magna]|uniref:Uncharacterized protein n=1 Tax=Daphnia magna TaxID=35525 RepID=A0ABQ9ZDC0_9CRUS|nr:hypothetical protein OUZ56_020029 [Daphnia magna]